ncbi:MAG: DUF309 domain-containing protein [Armatimonadota bacterium]|nr:DUF309 domain-containing protein [Armatimonadota bacterium]
MYVRLKHALSALALDVVKAPALDARRAEVAWLRAYCEHASRLPARHSFAVPLAKVARRARPFAADRTAPRRLARRGVLEIDAGALWLPAGFHTHFAYMDRQVRRLAAVARTLVGARLPRGTAGAVRRGAALFDGGLFFECHEYLEGLWRNAPEATKPFYQGVILVAAAFYHYEKANLHGARVKLASGIDRLRECPPVWHGVHLGRWLSALAPWQDRVEAGLPAGILKVSEIPKIPLVRTGGRRGSR